MKIKKILILILLLCGSGLILYPCMQMILSSHRQSVVVEKAESNMLHYDINTVNKDMQKAKEYNQSILGTEIKDPFIPGSGIVLPENYMEVLNIGEGIMGILEIPSINIKLPIYHGTSEEVLRKGVGHLKETALPIGQEGGHTVLSTHRGLPEAKLFTDLDKLSKNDQFYIYIYNKVLAYKIDQIKIVEPSNTKYLQPVKGKDYITLITCTPYGINSHRLMVRGVRTKYIKQEKDEIKTKVFPTEYVLIGTLIVFLIIIVLIRQIRQRRKPRT